MILVKNILKKYDNKKVVNDVSVNIEKGKITSFIGPNGAGKSTLLSIITRLMKRDLGEVYIEGKEISQWDKKELSKKIAILKQSNNLNMRLTIRELVSFGRFPYCEGRLTEEDEKFVDDAIEYMNLVDIQNKYLDELSGGQRQRAFIAMVIVLLISSMPNLSINTLVAVLSLNIIIKLHKSLIVTSIPSCIYVSAPQLGTFIYLVIAIFSKSLMSLDSNLLRASIKIGNFTMLAAINLTSSLYFISF